MRRGYSPDEWDAMSLADQQAIAWWQYVEATGYRPLTAARLESIPIAGGQRTRAYAAHEAVRKAIYPSDEE